MLFFKRKFDQIKCINGCDLFEDNNNFSYWENNEVTSDEKEIVLSAHYLEPEIDSGDVIRTLKYDLPENLPVDLEEKIQLIRDNITPLFSRITLETIEIFENE